MICDLGKDATTPLESSAVIADADYLINGPKRKLTGWGRQMCVCMKCVDFQEELLATKPKNV